MLFAGLFVVILIAAAFGFLAPRTGLVIGPTLIAVGVAPVMFFSVVPPAIHFRLEEQYGMLVTFAFVGLSFTGLMITMFCTFSGRR